MLKKAEEKKELERLAKVVVGSVSLKEHKEWRTKRKLQRWLKKLRREWK